MKHVPRWVNPSHLKPCTPWDKNPSSSISSVPPHLCLYYISTAWIWNQTAHRGPFIRSRASAAQETDVYCTGSCNCCWFRQTYRSIWESPRSARWSGRALCPARRGECAASHRGRSRRRCQPAAGTLAAAPLEDWWSQTQAGQCCCTHLDIREMIGEGGEWVHSSLVVDCTHLSHGHMGPNIYNPFRSHWILYNKNTHTYLWWSRRPCSWAAPRVCQAGRTRPRSHTAPRWCAAGRAQGPGPGPGLGPGAGRGPGRPAWLTSHWWREKGAMGFWSWSSTRSAGPPDGQETAGTATWRGGGTERSRELYRATHSSMHCLFPYRVFNFKCCCWVGTVLSASKLNKSTEGPAFNGPGKE